jgi:hypothetical protein
MSVTTHKGAVKRKFHTDKVLFQAGTYSDVVTKLPTIARAICSWKYSRTEARSMC